MLFGLGVVGLVSPQVLADVARRLLTPVGLVLVAAIRLLFGVMFVLATSDARWPVFLQVIGIISIVAGVITPIFGVDRHRRILDWWTARGSVFMRAWSGVAVILGVVLAYAVVG